MRTLAPALFGLVALLLLPLLTGPTPAWSEEEEAKPESEMWKRLKARDADGDGAIRRDEFPGRDRMWNRLDADGDGVVTREEADKASTGRRGRGQGGGPGGPGGRSGRGA
ncbi:MAG: hypothetical protein P1V36_17845, partial [Planctomycetota bacterium]|nr:hypothetical protein [Planctomycetota bacterium]